MNEHKIIYVNNNSRIEIVQPEYTIIYSKIRQRQPVELFYEKAVRKYFALFTGKNLCGVVLRKLKAFIS